MQKFNLNALKIFGDGTYTRTDRHTKAVSIFFVHFMQVVQKS